MSTTNKPDALSTLTIENRSLVDRAKELHAGQTWIGSGSVFNTPSTNSPHPKWYGIERRGVRPLTADDVARVLHLTAAEVAVLASRKAIPGAFRNEKGELGVDSVEFRSWIDDLHETIDYLPR